MLLFVEKHQKTFNGCRRLVLGLRSAPGVTSNYRVPPAELLLAAKQSGECHLLLRTYKINYSPLAFEML